ncbi:MULTISPECIES: sensor histidine kinase [Limnochorda]|uniref:sensor histidine kinase n=1 Tax=Limnochorda TaxID=1676651 RepID=UPI0026EEC764|nr:ATP-binding protein [Limnochorda pilosa]
MSRSERDGLLVWITVFMLALVAVLAVGLAASLSGQLDRRGGAVDEWARSLLPLAVAILIAGLALWASRLMVDSARQDTQRELELAQLRAELALAQREREQRHDVLNHLTVISALIQMGSPQQALAYLQRVLVNQEAGAAASGDDEQDPGILLGLLGPKLVEAGRAGVSLTVCVEGNAERLCIPDVVAARILGNLINNAIDAAALAPEQGEVRVNMALTRHGWALRVWNNGPIIPADQLKRIFTPGETSKGGEHQGLGLHIVQQLVREYGGRIGVQSHEPTGTEFVVTFDRVRSETAAARGVKLLG